MSKNIYLISCILSGEKVYKIGYTKRNVEQRINELKTGNPISFNIEKVYIADKYGTSIETNLHKHYITKKIKGEWFSLDEKDVEIFEELCDKFYNNFDIIQNNNTYLEESGFKFK